jgi:hypothetical protein
MDLRLRWLRLSLLLLSHSQGESSDIAGIDGNWSVHLAIKRLTPSQLAKHGVLS